MTTNLIILETLTKNIDVITRKMNEAFERSKSDLGLVLKYIELHKYRVLNIALIDLLSTCDTIEEYNKRKRALVERVKVPYNQEIEINRLLQDIKEYATRRQAIAAELVEMNNVYRRYVDYTAYLGGYELDDGDIQAYNELSEKAIKIKAEILENHSHIHNLALLITENTSNVYRLLLQLA
jgi:hypothetical protein